MKPYNADCVLTPARYCREHLRPEILKIPRCRQERISYTLKSAGESNSK